MITTYAVSLTEPDCTESQRIALVDLVSDWVVEHYPLDSRPAGLTVRTSRESSDDPVFRMTVTESAPGSTHVETLTLTVVLLDGHLTLDVRNVSTPATTRVLPYRTAPVPPLRLVHLVRDALDLVPFHDANRRITDAGTRVTTEIGGQEVAAFLFAQQRRLPAVVEIADPHAPGRTVLAAGAGPLTGLVHTFLIGNDAALRGFLDLSGQRLVQPGDVIIQWAGNTEPEVFHSHEVPVSSVPKERDRLIRLVIDTAARSVASPRVPPPPRLDAGIIDEPVREESEETESPEESAIYIDQLQSQIDDLEASLADADRIIADQRTALERKSGEVDELVLQKVNLEIRAGSDSATVRAVPSMKEALRIAREKCTFLVFHERAIESGEALEGPEPVSVLQDLARLNEVARAWMSGEISGNSIKLACRQMGLDFAPDVSDNARQKYEQDYVIDWHGHSVVAGAHLRRGRKSHLVRIHLHFDTERQQVVVAYIGRHLRDKGSSS